MRNIITFTSHGPVLQFKHSAPLYVFTYVSLMFRLLKITLLTVTITFKVPISPK